jgi:hypothetical protein
MQNDACNFLGGESEILIRPEGIFSGPRESGAQKNRRLIAFFSAAS